MNQHSPTRTLLEGATRVIARDAASSSTTNAVDYDGGPVSVSTLFSTLAPVAAYAGLFFCLFLFLRRWYPRSYAPRSILKSLRPQERTPLLPSSYLGWFRDFFLLSDHHVLQSQSLDSYLFLRHLRVAVLCQLVGIAITWPILIPVNATGPGNAPGLNRISMSNAVSELHPMSYYRYYAHTFCAYLFFGFLIFMITRESIYYINLRQAYLVSPLYADRISSRTVMYTAVPDDYLDEEVLREMLGPEQVERIWIPQNTKDLEDSVEERDKLMEKLEKAETALIRTANAARLKQQNQRKDDEVRLTTFRTEDVEKADGIAAPSRWVKAKDRPHHRVKLFGLWGEKVDTIDYCRKELARIIPQVEEKQRMARAGRSDSRYLHSCFVQFYNLRDAQSAFQSLTHHQPLHMTRFTGIFPSEILWSNLRIRWWERTIRFVLTTSAVVAVIIFWSFPVAFVGALNSLPALVRIAPWLNFLQKVPLWLSGVVTGLLPSVLLALLQWVLPVFLRLMANLGGAPTKSDVEYTVQNTYFAFQVIQVFLVATLSSGIFKAVGAVFDNPTSIFTLLGQALPASSTLYFSYFIVQGLGVVSQTLLSLTGFIIFWAMSTFLDSTARKKYKRWTELSDPQLGTLYPIYTNLFVIAISYACVAPLVLLFSTIGLWLFYIAYKYNFLYVYQSQIDLKGLMYARALQQLFVGIYLAEICMIGLFAIGVGGQAAALGPFVLMIILLAFTAIFHMSLNDALVPLLNYLPKTLETEERRLLSVEADVEAGRASESDDHGPSAGSFKDSDMSPNSKTSPPTSPEMSANKSANDILSKLGKKPGWLAKFLRPDVYSDYYTMRKLVPRNFANIQYEDEIARRAYYHPSIYAELRPIWIPQDEAGLSKEEMRNTPKAIPITDLGAFLDPKNRIVWDREHAEAAPAYEEKIYY